MTLPALLLLASLTSAAEPTLIEKQVASARETVKARINADSFNSLAIAILRRAREIDNPALCSEADAAVSQALKLSPADFASRRTRVAVLHCQGRWADALIAATALNKVNPDDAVTWGLIAEEQLALGNYEAAVRAVQWMIDFRQSISLGFQRGAAVREIYGENDPAMDWWNSALRETPSTDAEERAFLLTHIARLSRITGKYDKAVESARASLALAPNYPLALDELALALSAQYKFPEALELLQLRLTLAPLPQTLYTLATTLQAAGKSEAAQRTFAAFEQQALPLATQPANANLALIDYYAGAGKRPPEAVRIAQQNLKQQPNLDAYAAYARALAAQGDWKAAAAQMTFALKTGNRNPAWLMDAARIARHSGDTAAARKYLQQALEAAPASALSDKILNELLDPAASK